MTVRLSGAVNRWAKTKTDTAMYASFTTTAAVMRKTKVSDGAGGQTDTYASVGTYACSFSKFPIRPFERENTNVIQAYSDWEFRFARDVEVLQTDRLDCEDREFEVVGARIGSYDSANHVLCLEIL